MIKSVFLSFKSTVRKLNSRGMVVTVTSVVHKYNETMGGVDMGDQLLLKFEPQFKSIKLWKKILFYLLTTATGIQRVVVFARCWLFCYGLFLSCFYKVWFDLLLFEFRMMNKNWLIDWFLHLFSNAYTVLCEKIISI